MSKPPLSRAVEEGLVEWFRCQRGVPQLELQDDRDAVGIIHPGSVWGNAIAGLRLRPENVKVRLDQMIERYQANGRGVGFWISEHTTPPNLGAELAQHGLRCRKHFPGMYCELSPTLSRIPIPAGVRVVPVLDHSIFRHTPHPYWGRINTPIRRFELGRLMYLVSRRPQRVWEFVAVREGLPVGAATISLGRRVAGVWDVGVLEQHRRRGIGAALVAHACAFARQRGMEGAVLIASGMGAGVYERVGFAEVGKMSYWYSRLGRVTHRGMPFRLTDRMRLLIT